MFDAAGVMIKTHKAWFICLAPMVRNGVYVGLMSVLWSCSAESRTVAADATIPKPFSRYVFDEQSCHTSRFVDSGYNSLQKLTDFVVFEANNTTTATKCMPGIGLQVETKTKTKKQYPEPNQDFIDGADDGNGVIAGTLQNIWEDVVFSQQGVSIEIWFKTPTLDTQIHDQNSNTVSRQPILTIKRQDLNLNSVSVVFSDRLTLCDTYEYDFQLSQFGDNTIDISFRTSDTYFEACQTIHVPFAHIQNTTENKVKSGLLQNHLNHIVVSLRNLSQIVYVNGIKYVETLSAPFSNGLRHWNVTNDRIYL
jgi:hypothetical protein